MPSMHPDTGALAADIDLLDRDVERPDLPRDPYALVLYENAGYLVDDERRKTLFDRLIARASKPAALLSAPAAALFEIARDGGMRPEQRVERWYEIARRTLDAGGDLREALDAGTPRDRVRLLEGFPSLGAAGAAKIRLFALDEPCATIESNGLRVLERLGYVSARAAYAAKYREAVTLLERTYASADALQRAWFVLRHHGKSICRRSGPAHERCSVGRRCG